MLMHTRGSCIANVGSIADYKSVEIILVMPDPIRTLVP